MSTAIFLHKRSSYYSPNFKEQAKSSENKEIPLFFKEDIKFRQHTNILRKLKKKREVITNGGNKILNRNLYLSRDARNLYLNRNSQSIKIICQKVQGLGEQCVTDDQCRRPQEFIFKLKCLNGR